MFRSRAVAYVNPSSSCKTLLILGIGNGFLTIHLFTSLKSLTKCTDWYHFGTIKEGEAHSDSGCNFRTPNLHSLCTTFSGSLYGLLELEMACHNMVLHPPSAWGRQAQCPNHLVFYQKDPWSWWGASATFLDQEHSGLCSCLLLLHWDLRFHT